MIKSNNFPASILDSKYLESKNEITLKKFVGILNNELFLKKLSKNDIRDMKHYSNNLKSKKVNPAICQYWSSAKQPSC